MPGPAQGDRATAMTLVSSILMALIHRMKTGEGSWVGTSLLGNGLWSCGVIAQAALVGAYLPHRPPPDRPRSALGNIYRTVGRSLAAAHHRARGQDVAAALPRPSAAPSCSTIRASPTIERTAQALGRTGRHPGRRLRQPRLRALAQGDVGARHHLRRHQPAAGRAATTSRPWPAAPSSTPPSPTCRALWPIRSASASPSSRSPSQRRRSASTATQILRRGRPVARRDRRPAGERRDSMSAGAMSERR